MGRKEGRENLRHTEEEVVEEVMIRGRERNNKKRKEEGDFERLEGGRKRGIREDEAGETKTKTDGGN